MKGTIRFALGLMGMDEETMNEIDKALPAVDRLLSMFQSEEPAIKQAYSDVVSVIPVAKKLLAFINKEK